MPPVSPGPTVTVAVPSPTTAVGALGVPGLASGVSLGLGLLDGLVPASLEAATVNSWGVPLVSPEMVQLVAGGVTVQVLPPGIAVTV